MFDKAIRSTTNPVFLLCLFLSLSGCRNTPPRIGTGEEWRSWSAAERRQYLTGYIEGQLAGIYAACHLADKFALEDGKDLHVNQFPSRQCQDAAPKYSKARIALKQASTRRGEALDVSEYTNVLDTFFAHPECRVMPYDLLLQHLNDNEFKSGEDLYRFVRSGPGWGTFTGLDGMERCLPGYENR